MGEKKLRFARQKNKFKKDIRDRPFNLKGGGGGYGFLLRSEIFFWTTQELEYLFFCRAKRNFFSPINTSKD
jgi:hypothetical protein